MWTKSCDMCGKIVPADTEASKEEWFQLVPPHESYKNRTDFDFCCVPCLYRYVLTLAGRAGGRFGETQIKGVFDMVFPEEEE